MPSHEFQRICRDLSQFSDSLTISCTKDGVEFSASGDVGRAKITVRQNACADKEEEQVRSVCITFTCTGSSQVLGTRFQDLVFPCSPARCLWSWMNQCHWRLPVATSTFSQKPHPSHPLWLSPWRENSLLVSGPVVYLLVPPKEKRNYWNCHLYLYLSHPSLSCTMQW